MNARLVVLVGVLSLGFTMMAAAGAYDAKALVGVWEMTKGERIGNTYEFTKDGKLKVNKKSSKDAPLVGTYELKGKKLSISIAFGDKTEKQTITIQKLTDKQLVVLDPDKKEIEFKRVR